MWRAPSLASEICSSTEALMELDIDVGIAPNRDQCKRTSPLLCPGITRRITRDDTQSLRSSRCVAHGQLPRTQTKSAQPQYPDSDMGD